MIDPIQERGVVRLFKRRQTPARQRVAPAEHAVIVHYAMSDDEFGTADERERIFALEDRIAAVIESERLGEHDGNEFVWARP